MIEKAGGEYEVHWAHVIRAARVPEVDRPTAAKDMKHAGYGVKWRPPRLKLARGETDQAERERICNKLRKLLWSFWLKAVGLYTGDKK